MNEKILLVGAGRMAIEYAKVLKSLNKPFICVGRSFSSAKKFMELMNIPAETGGLKKYLKENTSLPSSAIVTVNIEQLCPVTLTLLEHGVKRILIEKPGGIDSNEIGKIVRKSEKVNAEVYVAYNRRFYSSTFKAEKIIKNEGGMQSFHFDFTELSHLISKSNINSVVKKNWLLANSTHVIDTAFYFGGEPKYLTCHTSGSLDWHPTSSIFTGSGITKENILFSYHANWNSPGRWGLELMTEESRLILRPMEELYIQRKDSFEIEKVPISDDLDYKFKPGLFLLVKSFFNSNNDKRLVTIDEQYRKTTSWYDLIAKGMRE